MLGATVFLFAIMAPWYWWCKTTVARNEFPSILYNLLMALGLFSKASVNMIQTSTKMQQYVIVFVPLVVWTKWTSVKVWKWSCTVTFEYVYFIFMTADLDLLWSMELGYGQPGILRGGVMLYKQVLPKGPPIKSHIYQESHLFVSQIKLPFSPWLISHWLTVLFKKERHHS